MQKLIEFVEDLDSKMEKYGVIGTTIAFIAATERDTQYREAIKELLERMDNFPCSMSCYTTQEEQKAAQSMKKHMTILVKEYLED